MGKSALRPESSVNDEGFQRHGESTIKMSKAIKCNSYGDETKYRGILYLRVSARSNPIRKASLHGRLWRTATAGAGASEILCTVTGTKDE